ncbi:anti-sigma-K factor RskA [Pelomonas saccharophila]|uniref:Anti-sigma-K factor RskA n=1 Tax=Roseateles saccharophilus TaxID=304 RepID=A0ABU1YM33_ROSSA|nr:anti-sigma factor [Roseateles saccharophilus]MDR7269285.1 anti-sigma-K factor RskA [Roseateles saccharophilus]
MIDLRDPAERDAAAGEYVLGTLGAEDHAAVAAALPHDAALRADVYAWQDRMLPLSAQVAAAEPTTAVWRRLSLALDGRQPPRKAAEARTPWWQGLRFWQGLSAVGVAASLLLALRLLAPLPVAEGARYVALLESPDERHAAGWVVELQAGGALRLLPVGDTPPVPPGRALQFWTKPQGAAGPTSLGLVRAGEPVEMPVSRLPAVGAQQLFEITLEPEAGSPIGKPTGPILFVGRTVAL